ncbi:MAG: TolC family protein [Methylobacter sp.]|nr:TolC family protein [Methylobacter sp.]MDP2097160.1 TolC family protein [Methylobacter sp.]MDP2429571.1 TolC family protein [Methylobacter sp.]MDP3054142.1 TolC family protein [Methylobacter sp.]MDP3361235.1 TolC family protein [Methylobacter sp.]
MIKRLPYLSLLVLTGCSYYFDTGPERKIAQRVEQRLSSDEQLSLPPLSKTAPLTIEQALPKFKERQTRTVPDSPPAKAPEKAVPKASNTLSISQVRALALENNLELKIAQINPKIAAADVSEEQAKFDDLIFARAKYGSKNTPAQNLDVVTFTPAESSSSLLKGETDKLTAVPQRTDILDMEAGIVIPLRTGAKMTLSVPFDEKRQFKGVASEQYLNALRFSISQPLLRDGGIDTNVAGIRIARYEQQAVDVSTRLQAIRVLAAVERGYWGLYVAWGELDVRRQQYENAADNLAMVRKRVAEGITAAVEINRAEIGVAERMEGLIVAETTLKLRQRQLKLLLNDPEMDLDTATVLIPETTPTLLQFTFDREQLAQQALQGRLELLELELKLAADMTKIDYLSNQTLPLFMLDYNYSSLGRDTASFGGAFGQSLDGDYSDWSVGLRMELPLTNELRRARRDRSIQQRLQRLTTLQLRELSVRREIYDTLDQLEQNWQRILAARQNVLLAGINYDAELKQFREGLRTMTEVLETLTRLGDAQLREVRAIGDYQISMIDLAFATGTLLGHSRVDWDSAADGGL